MSRYIDADALYIELKRFYGLHLSDVLKIVENFPTADVQEVKHGKWINVRGAYVNTFRECNLCHHVTDEYVINENKCCFDAPYYCPHCGAKMDEQI